MKDLQSIHFGRFGKATRQMSGILGKEIHPNFHSGVLANDLCIVHFSETVKNDEILNKIFANSL